MILQVLGIGFGLRSPRPLAAAVGELDASTPFSTRTIRAVAR
jgi:hypothetical protein